jgi:hypothetical protein
MERTSLLTVLLLADATSYSSLTLVNGLPDTNSMTAHFKAVPMVLERADFQERTEDTPQGQILRVSIRAVIHRDSSYYTNYPNRRVIAYVETANGERYLWGSNEYPMTFDYQRDSGAGNADDRFTQLTMELVQPI